jgi:hypothetical protein
MQIAGHTSYAISPGDRVAIVLVIHDVALPLIHDVAPLGGSGKRQISFGPDSSYKIHYISYIR